MASWRVHVVVCLAAISSGQTSTWANVLHMPAGQTSLETVVVGDPYNTPDSPYLLYGDVDYLYAIGKYEVTAAQYTLFLNAVARVDAYGLYNPDMAGLARGCGISRTGAGTASLPYAYSVAAASANRPVNYVCFWDACRFANWLHNGQPTGAQGAATTEAGAYRLNGYTGSDGGAIRRSLSWKWAVTSDDEWHKAAYYKGGSRNAGYWDYPTCSNAVPGRDTDDPSGNNANFFGLGGSYPIDSPHYLTTVGEFQNSSSAYGTFDQAGNVSEWNESVSPNEDRGTRGGSYTSEYGPLSSWARGSATANYEANSIGFRVVAVPEPAMLSLLVLALAVLGSRRW